MTGIGVAMGAMSPIRPNVIWAMDFQFGTTADGRTLKMLNVIDEFTRFNSSGPLFIDPGSPWQNAWNESFNGRPGDKLLNYLRFDSLLEARMNIEDWRCDYNANRPHRYLPQQANPATTYTARPKARPG